MTPMRDQTRWWGQLLVGLIVVFTAFQTAADGLGSDRGQAGLVVGLLVVAATLGAQRLFFQPTFGAAANALGLGPPGLRGLMSAAVLGGALLLVIPAFLGITQSSVALYPGSGWLLMGLFAQAGIAEEILFRGYLYGNLRRRHSFWRAATLSMVPFVVVHLMMFATLPWTVALAALLLAVAMSFPLAWLFELGGGTVWAPALLHFVAQGALKVLVVSGPSSTALPLVWIAACGAIPWLALLVPRPVGRPD